MPVPASTLPMGDPAHALILREPQHAPNLRGDYQQCRLYTWWVNGVVLHDLVVCTDGTLLVVDCNEGTAHHLGHRLTADHQDDTAVHAQLHTFVRTHGLALLAYTLGGYEHHPWAA